MKVAYDLKLMRPGCIIVAAGMGADSIPCAAFDTEDWLLAPTPDMKVYDTTEGQLKQLVEMTRKARERRKETI